MRAMAACCYISTSQEKKISNLIVGLTHTLVFFFFFSDGGVDPFLKKIFNQIST